jgi:hypothetical protein
MHVFGFWFCSFVHFSVLRGVAVLSAFVGGEAFCSAKINKPTKPKTEHVHANSTIKVKLFLCVWVSGCVDTYFLDLDISWM